MRLSDLAGRAVAIWGTGREGISAAHAVAALAPSSLIAVDENPARDADSWREASGGSVPLHVGPGVLSVLLDAQVVVKSPGVPRVHPWLIALSERGVQITSGTALWMADHADHTIAVTGTKGKSTTSALIHHLLVGLGRDVNFAGNIGAPLLGTAEAALHVVELSSQQCQSLETSPRWAVLTSLFPEHLDWHGSERQYYQDKLNLLAHTPHSVVINALDARLVCNVETVQPPVAVTKAGLEDAFHIGKGPGGAAYFQCGQTPLFPRETLSLLGQHNAGNLCVALTLLDELGIDCVQEKDRIASVVRTFSGLAHRLQQIPDPIEQLIFINDSLSTAPQSAIAALESFDSHPVTLIVGGTDRGLDYRVLRDYLTDTRTAPITVLAIPDSGPRIAAELQGVPNLNIEVVGSLSEAVARARVLTPPGGIVLLSPAAPSYGRFTDYAHRGEVFARAVQDSAR